MDSNEEKESKRDDDEISLIVGSEKFTCSRALLMTNSLYFCTLFRPDHGGFLESKLKEITLKTINPEAFSTILKCLAGRETEAKKLQVYDYSYEVMETSAFLQFETIFEQCVNIASEKLDDYNCLHFMNSAEQLGAKNLQRKARYHAMWEFSFVSNTPYFFEMNVLELETYLKSNMLRAANELEVLESALLWIEHKLEERKCHLERLLECARWKAMGIADLRTVLSYTVIIDNEDVLGTLNKITSLVRQQNERYVSFCEQSTSMICDEVPDPTSKALLKAKYLLSLPPRIAPQLPCFIGYRLLSRDSDILLERNCEDQLKTLSIGYYNVEKKQLDVLMDIEKNSGQLEFTGYSVISVGKNVYVFGGEHQIGLGRWNATVWCYDLMDASWEALDSLPSPKRHASICELNGDIYLLGGVGKYRIIADTCFKFNIKNALWTVLPPMPEKLSSSACCIHKGRVFIVGSQIHSFNPTSQTWCTLKSVKLPTNMGCHSAFSYEDQIYLTGKYTKEIICFNPEEAEMEVEVSVESVGHFLNNTQKSCFVNGCIYVYSNLGVIFKKEREPLRFNSIKVNDRIKPTSALSLCVSISTRFSPSADLIKNGRLCVETYNLKKKEFSVLWNSSTDGASPFNHFGFVDFMPDQNGGCFPVLDCWGSDS